MGFFSELFGAISQAVDNANEAVKQKYNELLGEDDDELRRIEKSNVSSFTEKTAAHQVFIERVDEQEKLFAGTDTDVLMAMLLLVVPGTELYDPATAMKGNWSTYHAIIRILRKRNELTEDDLKEILPYIK